ncbi:MULTISPECIES: hypothetical protein [Streptomyces]|uniref:hypothetical protein n=1 Tax=Streptomyces TaxID=1883 RepID=UPI0004AA68AA|nr:MULTISPECIES: hypothetical protein [Streptomyces]
MITAPSGGAPRPTAGALRLTETRTADPASVDVSGYLAAMQQHCPFLQPSTAHGMTGWTVYEIAPGAHRYAVEAELFYAGMQAAEWIRPLMTRPYGTLACENVVVLGQCADADHRGLLTWPHWALKNLYSQVGVMFGKFVTGAAESSRAGRSIPSAPFSFLPVRAAVRPLDPRFLTSTPDLAVAVARAVDDGRDVFEHIPCEWKAVREWASSLLKPCRH